MSEEPRYPEVVMCERCCTRLADVIVNLKFIADDAVYPLVALCAGCFLSVYKDNPGIKMM